jgi:hypothetical protein
VPPIEFFCEKFAIPDEAAGASFLAFGSSAPEIAIATISTLSGGGEGGGGSSAHRPPPTHTHTRRRRPEPMLTNFPANGVH